MPKKKKKQPKPTVIPPWMISQYLKGNFGRDKMAKYLKVSHNSIDRALLRQQVKKPKTAVVERDPEIVKRDAHIIELHLQGQGYRSIAETITNEGKRIGKHRVEQIVRAYKYDKVVEQEKENKNLNVICPLSDRTVPKKIEKGKFKGATHSVIVHEDLIPESAITGEEE